MPYTRLYVCTSYIAGIYSVSVGIVLVFGICAPFFFCVSVHRPSDDTREYALGQSTGETPLWSYRSCPFGEIDIVWRPGINWAYYWKYFILKYYNERRIASICEIETILQANSIRVNHLFLVWIIEHHYNLFLTNQHFILVFLWFHRHCDFSTISFF